jgi:hypothetical protein
MSLAEIKDEVRRMTPDARKELARLIIELDDASAMETPRPAASFGEAKAYVFDNYGELLRRLAQ